MVKINVISGFLGAGKTTLIKKLLTGSLRNEKVVLLENEYGEIGIDGGFMKDAGITVTELNAGCICCTLAGDFQAAVDQLIDTYHPDRILVEPTGVGKLSEILSAVEKAKTRHPEIEVGGSATVVDAGKCRMYMKNFGEFFLDQVKSASTVIFSRTQLLDAARVEKSRLLIAEAHPDARIITTPWDDMEPDFMLDVIENGCTSRRWKTMTMTTTMTMRMSMNMSMSIIITMTMRKSIITIMTGMTTMTMTTTMRMSMNTGMSIIITMTMSTVTNIITTITTTARESTTRMKSSATSAWRQRSATGKRKSDPSWKSCPMKRNTAGSSAPRASCRPRTGNGSSLTMFPVKLTCGTAVPIIPAACA